MKHLHKSTWKHVIFSFFVQFFEKYFWVGRRRINVFDRSVIGLYDVRSLCLELLLHNRLNNISTITKKYYPIYFIKRFFSNKTKKLLINDEEHPKRLLNRNKRSPTWVSSIQYISLISYQIRIDKTVVGHWSVKYLIKYSGFLKYFYRRSSLTLFCFICWSWWRIQKTLVHNTEWWIASFLYKYLFPVA